MTRMGNCGGATNERIVGTQALNQGYKATRVVTEWTDIVGET